jgi:hypothetical protein
MWKDEILEEIYRIREEHARAFNYDLKAICNDLRQRQTTNGRTIISKPLRRPCQRHNNPNAPERI